MQFDFTEDRNIEIHEHIDELFKLTDETSEQRSQNANDLIESYMAVVPGGYATGKRTASYSGREEMQSGGERMATMPQAVTPPSGALERLGSYIMREDYEDPKKNKVQTTEYPTHSERQTKHRESHEFPNDDIGSYNGDSSNGYRTSYFKDGTTGVTTSVKTKIRPEMIRNTTKRDIY